MSIQFIDADGETFQNNCLFLWHQATDAGALRMRCSGGIHCILGSTEQNGIPVALDGTIVGTKNIIVMGGEPSNPTFVEIADAQWKCSDLIAEILSRLPIDED